MFFRTPDNSISLQSKYNLLYKPNDPSAIGIRFQLKWLGLSIAYSPKRLQNKNKGNTSELDLHCFAYGRKQYLDLRYLDYTGFYIDNFKQNDTLKKYYSTYPLYPSLSLRSIGVNYCFLFKHKKLSLRASFNHNEIQRKSAGSFILGVSYNYTSFYNPTDFIPVELRPQSPPTEQYVDLRYHEISVMPGYAFTLVFKKFYFTLAPMLGIVGQHQNINHTDQITSTSNNIAFRSLSKSAFGYNNERFFIAITGTNDTYNYALADKVRMRTQFSEAKFIVGYRFVPKGYLKKISDKMDIRI